MDIHQLPWWRGFIAQDTKKRKKGKKGKKGKLRGVISAAVIAAVLALLILTWAQTLKPQESPHNSAGAIRHHAKQVESALSE